MTLFDIAERKTIKGLSLTQPYAQLVAAGKKCIETRSWQTKYRGLLAIHAAKSFPKNCRAYVDEPAFADALRDELGFPTGAIVAVARLEAIGRVPHLGSLYPHVLDTYSGREPFSSRIGQSVPPRQPELSFGDYTPGRFAWWLGDVVRLPEPVPYRGALSLWEVPADVLDAVNRQNSLKKEASRG